jgi:hypothetical protein
MYNITFGDHAYLGYDGLVQGKHDGLGHDSSTYYIGEQTSASTTRARIIICKKKTTVRIYQLLFLIYVYSARTFLTYLV